MEFKDKDVEFKHLIDTIHTYLPQAKCDDVTKAYNLAEEAHKDQRRVSGEPYILHPLAVAQILADMKIDTTTITASLLHDVVEDTSYTLEDIKKMFGKEVAFLVDGVTKLSRLNYRTKEDQQLNSMRKMFLAMAKDVRVVVIKLADRLHNMRTLRYMRSDKQKRIAQETLEIFAPLAHRLGIFNIKWELEDLSFRYLEPDKYYDLVDQMKQKRHVREEIVNEAIDVLKKALDEAHIHCEINGRPKHFYSIYKKMKKDNRDLSQVYDLFAIRVIVDDVKDCYGVLGIVHSLWKPLPYRFKDYIAMPKPNNYQSLHTTVIGTRGQPVEIQIRTWEMHRIAEYGVAAHWRYKEGNQTANKDAFDEKMGWLRNLLEWQDTSNPKEFVNALKLDAFSDEVFVFSPRGDVIDLPQGAIPIDFAYRIHTDVGHRCVGAKINGKIVPLVNLAKYLEKESTLTDSAKIIVTEFNHIMTGFLVSGVNRIHRLSWNEVEEPGAFLQNMSHSSITGVVRLEERVVFLLDMESIVAELDPALSIRLGKLPDEEGGEHHVYTILHADDSGNIRSLVKRLMEESGRFRVIQTSSGEEAWNVLLRMKREHRDTGRPINEMVQAVISDIEMPRMDGLTLCRHIKEDPELNYLPVALFSSLITDKLEHKGESVGADAQFAKPDLQVLSEKVLELIALGKNK